MTMTTTNSHHEPISSPFPIVIAGGGCVGLFLALLLTKSAIPNPITVIEPNSPNPSDTRAMAHQPLIFPLFAEAGLMPDLARLGTFSSGLCFRTSAANGSKLIAGKTFNVQAGEKAQLLLPQWKFQELLINKVEESKSGEIRLGWKVVGFEEQENNVHVRIQNEKEEEETIEAEYLVGADGAKSTIRKLLSVPFSGETLPTNLVATDILFNFHKYGFYDANFIIDPQDYGLIGRIDDNGLWRVSYGVEAGMTEEDIKNGVDGKLKKMLPGEGNDGYVVKRIAPYKAQQRCADQFWKGRVGLLGDAAHLTNPYAGLGLASGIADASSLAKVLTHTLNPTAHSASTNPSTLLSSWSTARREKFLAVVDKPSRMAHARVRTKVDSEEEIQGLLERDPLVGALKKGMPMMPPSLVTEVEGLEGW